MYLPQKINYLQNVLRILFYTHKNKTKYLYNGMRSFVDEYLKLSIDRGLIVKFINTHSKRAYKLIDGSEIIERLVSCENNYQVWELIHKTNEQEQKLTFTVPLAN